MLQVSFLPKTFRVYFVALVVVVMCDVYTAPTAWAQANTAFGTNALGMNTTGNLNSAFGFNALGANTTGSNNSATGVNTLPNNTSGNNNTANGVQALFDNTTGGANVAIGGGALFSNTTGSDNSATGVNALSGSTTGINNTANGANALGNNTTGSNNTASGFDALFTNTTGGNNIAIGNAAGFNLTTGSNNVLIGNSGVAGESNKIRIGTPGMQNGTFIAGISGRTVTSGAAVLVNSSGQLGTLSSSARYKRDIHDMGDASDKLMKLRPVIFHYKADPTGTQQYGLIAEEVARVYPDLVVNGADGKPETVAYHLLPAMLLNELKKQSHDIRQLTRANRQKDQQIASLQRELAAVQKKNVQFDALMAARLDALERQAGNSRPERLAGTIH